MLLTHYPALTVPVAAAAAAGAAPITVRQLGLQAYAPLYAAMAYRARHGRPGQTEELWVLSHKPVFTLGQAGKPEHVLDPGDIPVVPVDRGGQVTYHGPGQLVVYPFLDLHRRHLGARDLVELIESALLDALAGLDIVASTRAGAPGVYVDGAKIAALGLRISRGRSYHGLSLNIDMDLAPFQRINPCGYPGMAVTQVRDCLPAPGPEHGRLMEQVCGRVVDALLVRLHCTPTGAQWRWQSF